MEDKPLDSFYIPAHKIQVQGVVLNSLDRVQLCGHIRRGKLELAVVLYPYISISFREQASRANLPEDWKFTLVTDDPFIADEELSKRLHTSVDAGLLQLLEGLHIADEGGGAIGFTLSQAKQIYQKIVLLSSLEGSVELSTGNSK